MALDVRPDVIIPDTSPLIHLAAIGQLGLLHRIGRVIVPDMVKDEAVFDLTKPWAAELKRWFDEGERQGSNTPVEVPETETGKTVRLARQVDPTHRQRDAGERAILDWLADSLATTPGPPVVVYENGRIPNMIAREGLASTVIVATTRALLEFAERNKLLAPDPDGSTPTAEALWQRLAQQIPTANPRAQTRVVLPKSTP
jgi:hypothetical protein